MELKELQEKVVSVIENYSKTHGVAITKDLALIKLYEELWEFTKEFVLYTGKWRNKGDSLEITKEKLSHEFADFFCSSLFLAHLLDIDMKTAIEEKRLKYLK